MWIYIYFILTPIEYGSSDNYLLDAPSDINNINIFGLTVKKRLLVTEVYNNRKPRKTFKNYTKL